MSRGLGNLGDFFPEKDIRCRVKHCGNVWNFSGDSPPDENPEGPKRPDRMCDTCFSKYVQLEDREIQCATPDCPNTWNWTRLGQLESEARGYHEPPRGFCSDCRTRLNEMSDKKVPCRIRECDGTWSWYARSRLLSKKKTPPSRLCENCYQKLKKLRDRKISCRIDGCTRSWKWDKHHQLVHILKGKAPKRPPRRMCEQCYELYQTREKMQVPCCIKGCTRTWTFSRFDQVEHALKHGPDAKPPQRKCRPCFQFLKRASRRSMRCRNRGCKNKWTYTVRMQLERWLSDTTRQPSRVCDKCRTAAEEKSPEKIECMIPGCSNSWLYTPEDQVRDECLKLKAPQPHRCHDCEKFLASHPEQEIPCGECGSAIKWSAYEQLLCDRGTFVKPSRCSDCSEQKMSSGEEPDRETVRQHHLVVKMPPAGPWHKDKRIRDWPPHMTYEAIQRMEKADIRIVAFGDDLTYSSDNADQAWPALLEKNLNQLLEEKDKVAVVNAGIAQCNSRQALMRYARDVTPFDPHFVIFSFAFGDSLLKAGQKEDQWRHNITPEDAAEAEKELWGRLVSEPFKVIYWTANPIFPEDAGTGLSHGNPRWPFAQASQHRAALRRGHQLCTEYTLPILDLRSRFEVNGDKSARKWMTNWYCHNTTGAHNIATWFADYFINRLAVGAT